MKRPTPEQFPPIKCFRCGAEYTDPTVLDVDGECQECLTETTTYTEEG